MGRVRFKNIFEIIDVDYKFLFWKCSPIFSFQFGPIRDIFLLFGPFRAIFEVVVRFKNFFGTYLCRQISLVFELQPFLFIFKLTTFSGLFCIFLDPFGFFFTFGAFLGVGVRFKKLSETYLCR